MPSGTSFRRAALTSRLSTGFFSIVEAVVARALAIEAGLEDRLQMALDDLEPAASAATFCSSLTFQSMNDSMSG